MSVCSFQDLELRVEGCRFRGTGLLVGHSESGSGIRVEETCLLLMHHTSMLCPVQDKCCCNVSSIVIPAWAQADRSGPEAGCRASSERMLAVSCFLERLVLAAQQSLYQPLAVLKSISAMTANCLCNNVALDNSNCLGAPLLHYWQV